MLVLVEQLLRSFFLLWLIALCMSGVIGWIVARAKRAPFFDGFWWGFFLLAVGWLIVAIISGPLTRCLECHERVQAQATLCPWCRSSIWRPQKGNRAVLSVDARLDRPGAGHEVLVAGDVVEVMEAPTDAAVRVRSRTGHVGWVHAKVLKPR